MADTSTTQPMQMPVMGPTAGDLYNWPSANTGPTTTQAGSNTPIGTSSVYSAPAASPTTTSSAPAVNAANNVGNNISTAQTNQPATPSTSNPTGNPATQTPNSYVQFDGSYGSNPDPYGYGTANYNPASDPRVTAQTDSSNSIYKQEETQLQTERDQEIANLTQKQATDQAALQTTQANDTGSSNRNLAYLQQGGTSASAQAYLNSLEQSHQTAMNNLVAQYNQAIQTAKNAYTDKDFALAEKEVANAQSISQAAAQKNSDFLKYTMELRTQADTEAKNAYDMQSGQRQTTANMATFIQKNSTGAKPYVAFGGNVFDTQGNQIDPSQYQSLGITANNVEQISDTSAFQTDDTKNYAFYVKQMQQEGVQPTDFMTYVHSMAEAKSTKVNVNSGSGTFGTEQIDGVKAIIAANPSEWGKAADEIDARYGKGTSTAYDALLKANYALPQAARDMAKAIPANVTLDTWNNARQLFIQQNNYVDADTAGKMFDASVPKPGSKSLNFDTSQGSVGAILNSPDK